MDFEGTVVKRPFAVGSKSEHEAVMLVTEQGDYVLRRPGGQTYQDSELDRMVGMKIAGHGMVHGYLLVLSDWHEIPDKLA